ncbi:putative deoxyribonuclease RhsA [Arsenophonus endosymbiont of Aleurodicus floccissimus]|uniref:RHS repeat domain-containing protein n=1 Tax=Arsenophonus endosymbiont of Aleurodicus floccissimus TaxID=2152761 RepID=UPI000E6B0B3D|nr:RHS repeat-associated core domain-containing protein [Arsenophonus endosymbiont of Aleurodicus floccissimus]SPP30986.1 putative deoxyribonuclease RhsA [Arsenophonus endosymbiont of Aleurodicus floccissimus]
MNTPSYYTNAGNFISAAQGGVDPRTGLFNVHLPLVNTQANALMGPRLWLALSYSPLSTVNNGFGIGFRLNLSQYNKNTRQLLLSNGEEYRIGNNNQVKQQQLKNFIFKKLDDNTCQIIYKSGLTECLTLHSGEIYVPTKISSTDGRSLNLAWDSHFSPARLTRVTDDNGHILCSVAYPDNTSAITRFTLLQDNVEFSYNIIFAFNNERLISITSEAVTPTLTWSFDYDDIDPQGSYRVITGVHSPTGLIEKVSYYTQAEDRMAFPTIANLPPLPCVHQHRLIPGAGQPQQVTLWTYTKEKNYLGNNAQMNQWQPDQDAMLNILLVDYQYGSTAELKNAEGVTLSEVTRRYNSYHLMVSETTVRDGKTHVSETEYYAKKGVEFVKQPAQYVLPTKRTESWCEDEECEKKERTRSTVTLYQFDEFGNPVRQEAPDGTISEYTYYPAAGEGNECPADPYGFTRYIKTQTVTPPKKNGDEAISMTRYTWQKLEALTGNGCAIVQKIVEQTTGNKRSLMNNTYYSDKISPALYGRVNCQDVTLTPDINQKETFTNKELFTYNITANKITENREFIGHDGLTAKKTTVRHPWIGNVLSETSAQGIEISYAYDKLGRLINRTLCPGSDYETTTIWEYGVGNGGPYLIETDVFGNKNKTGFDGAGRAISEQRFDAETAKWYETFSCAYNSLGEISTGLVTDYLPAGNPNNYSMTANITYGGWGYEKEVVFSDGIKTLRQTDPIVLTQTVYCQGGTGNTALTSGNITTILDEKSQLPTRKILQENITGQAYSSSDYIWDGLGQLREEKDELERVTKRTYDEYGRVLTQILADGTIVSRTYAAHLTDNYVASISVTGPDANGTSKIWALGTQTFDSLGRVTKRVSGGRTTSYSYQGASPVPSMVTLPSGKTVEYTYISELDNVVSSMKADGIIQTFNYDKKTGKLLNAQEANSKLENTWSKADQLKEEAFWHNAQNRKAKHTYTLKGAPVTYTDVAGKQTQYSMDAYGRVTSITDDSLTVNLTYDALGRLNSQTVRGKASTSSLTTAFNYDSFGREITRTITDKRGITVMLAQSWLKNGLLASRTTQKNGIKLREEQYGYDERDRLVSYTALGDSLPIDTYGHRMTAQTYRYDALNNLTSVKTTLADRSTNMATYSYQNASDPSQQTTLTNTHDNYPKTINLSYDAEGRMTRDEAGRTLTYDVMGRLTSVSDEKTHRSGTYSYDALNRLITRNASNNDTRELYYRGAELVNEVTTSTNKETRLIKTGHTCLGITDDKGLTLTAGDKNDSLLWSEDTGTSNEGELHVWSPYGSGKPSDRLPGFNGERVDPVSGTYHLGNGYRAYNPVLMRFNCPDNLSPFGTGGINPYAYYSGDPINHTYPSGHLSWQAITGIIAGTIGLGLAVFTAGSSIAAAGGVMAALSSASASSLIIVGLGVASDITGIASGAMEDSNPEASATLGWVSLATGLAGMAVGIDNWGTNKVFGKNGSYNLSRSLKTSTFRPDDYNGGPSFFCWKRNK